MKDFNFIVKAIAAVMASASILSGCRPAATEDFATAVKAYSGGVIGSGGTIKIIMAEPVEESIAAGLSQKELDRLFSFSPGIKGNVGFDGKDTFEFIPEEDGIRPGTGYKARFNVGKVRPDLGKKMRTFSFSFRTAVRDVSIVADRILIRKETPDMAEICGRAVFSEPVDPQAVAEMLSCSVRHGKSGGDIRVHTSPGEDACTVDYSISGFLRGEDDINVSVSLDGTEKGFGRAEKISAAIPAAGRFDVMGARLGGGSSPYAEILFSAPLDESMNPDGILEASGGGRTFARISDNCARIYFEKMPESGITVNVSAGIRDSGGKRLGKAYSTVLRDEEPKPAVQLLLKGNILPDASELMLPFRAVNLNAVDISVIRIYEDNVLMFLQDNGLDGDNDLRRSGRLLCRKTIRLDSDPGKNLHSWQNFAVDLSGLFSRSPGAIYRIRLSFRPEYSLYGSRGGSSMSGLVALESGIPSDEEMREWDEPYPYYYESCYDWDKYDWKERDNPLDPTYYMQESRFPHCNLMSSDLGIIAKSAGTGKIWTAVTDILTAKPVKGARVTVYNYQLQEIGRDVTDSRGFTETPVSGKAFAVTAEYKDAISYLKVTDGSEKSVGRFDTGGEKPENGIRAFIYGERGVWRPGDTLHLTAVIKNDGEPLPDSHPVKMELYTPQGQFYSSQTDTDGKDGFHVFNVPTRPDDPTGTWNAWIKIGGSAFHKSLMIESIKPNRLKISLETDGDILHGGAEEQFGLSASWLSGTAAAGLTGKVEMSLTPAGKTFSGYDGYVFSDPTSSFTGTDLQLFSKKLDSRGKASAGVMMPALDGAPGLLQARLVSRVQEGGGDESIVSRTMLFSPYRAYAGIKLPAADGGWIETDKDHSFPVILTGTDGKPVPGHEMEYRIFKLDWSWWWESSSEELASYVNGTSAIPFSSGSFISGDSPYDIPFRLDYPDWGRFLVYVKDKTGGHATGGIISVDWPAYRGRSDKRDPDAVTMVTFSTDKKQYKAGETATVFVPAAKDGLALISLENGSRVISRDWAKTSGDGDTPFRFTVTEEMSPNIYIHISLIQKHGNTANDLPVRMYGVQPVFVDNPHSHLHPEIIMPDAVRPQEEFSVKVREKDGKKMTYTLAIVDEGLLDITAFRTPDPWAAMYGREALGVKTWDLFDEIAGAFGGRFSPISAVGGDQTVNRESKQDNRFNPVVKFLGPFTLSGKENTHRITLPMYVGSVRVMLVAGKDGAYGNAEKTVPVRTPLMILPTLPRVLGPGEEVILPINVFATEPGLDGAEISVSAEGPAEISGNSRIRIPFREPGDTLVRFRLKTTDAEGPARVTVRAKGGGYSASETVTVRVRNPNPPVTDVGTAVTGPGESHVFRMTAGGETTLALAGFPSIDFNGCFVYMKNYDHSCTEQISARGISMLSLLGLLSDENAAQVPGLVKELLSELYVRQLPDGGFAFWPGMAAADEWVTSMAGHFMVLAENKGYEVNGGVMSAWRNFQKNCVRSWRSSGTNDFSDLVQAYRLYTLALASSPETGAMNRMKESGTISGQAQWRLAAAYCLIGKPGIAGEMISGLKTAVSDYSASNVTYGTPLRDKAMMLETLVLTGDMAGAMRMAGEVADGFSSQGGYTTQTAAFASVAMGRLAEETATGAIRAEIIESTAANGGGDGTSAKRTVEKASATYSCTLSGSADAAEIRNLSGGPLFVTMTSTHVPPAGTEVKPRSSGLEMNISWTDTGGNPVNPHILAQGTDFRAAITVSNVSGTTDFTDLALTFPVPSGWEISNERALAGPAEQQPLYAGQDSGQYDYLDVRDDRAVFYFGLAAGSRKKFTVRLRAAYEGNFTLPAASCVMMYDPSVSANTGSGSATVTGQ